MQQELNKAIYIRDKKDNQWQEIDEDIIQLQKDLKNISEEIDNLDDKISFMESDLESYTKELTKRKELGIIIQSHEELEKAGQLQLQYD